MCFFFFLCLPSFYLVVFFNLLYVGFFFVFALCVCVRAHVSARPLVYLPEGHMVCVHMRALGFTDNCDPPNVDAVNESPDLFKSNKHSTISPAFFNFSFYCFEKLYHSAV